MTEELIEESAAGSTTDRSGCVVARVLPAEDSGVAEWSAEASTFWDAIGPRLPKRGSGPSAPARFARRTVDLAAGAVLLVVAAPVIAVLGILVMLDDGGPMFYGHTRLTRGGRPFRCWKIRTMSTSTDDSLRDPETWLKYATSDFKIADSDSRVTRLGRFLRRSHLDELPQFWNVVRGDLSCVGPRPVTSVELKWWGPHADELLSIRPGVFGAWQLTNHMPYPDRAYLELSYGRSRAAILDVEILVRTLLTILLHGTYAIERLVPADIASAREHMGRERERHIEPATSRYPELDTTFES